MHNMLIADGLVSTIASAGCIKQYGSKVAKEKTANAGRETKDEMVEQVCC
jgi:hypothetical protein